MVFLKFVLDFRRSSGGQAMACAAWLHEVVARRCDGGMEEKTRDTVFGVEDGQKGMRGVLLLRVVWPGGGAARQSDTVREKLFTNKILRHLKDYYRQDPRR